ncbi:TPA: hypothetical protein N0F65_001740 [Lagenidium giganteum]|uniref:Uncharacterized protein n=1 Tax=Lagenidium giganteum TaxID=4803 RepID=A0AAV2Z5V8_9STRA|nr:TPA: hypothetical protein N0F65_001740 [Lagenidium giganteum]
MNMTLLPIARPLPVSISAQRWHEGIGAKPRTPNQKLRYRLMRHGSNISPRRHDLTPVRQRQQSAGASPAPLPQPALYSPTGSLSAAKPTTSSGGLFKGKRILELQDEERRLVPEERASTSPAKRCRLV